MTHSHPVSAMWLRGGLAAALLAAATLTGCGDGKGGDEQAAYCVDGAGRVVDSWHCDGADPMFWYMMGSWSHPWRTGQTINVTNVHVTRVPSADRAARTRYGLPPTGRVTTGQKVTPPKPAGASTGNSSAGKAPAGSSKAATGSSRGATGGSTGGSSTRIGTGGTGGGSTKIGGTGTGSTGRK